MDIVENFEKYKGNWYYRIMLDSISGTISPRIAIICIVRLRSTSWPDDYTPAEYWKYMVKCLLMLEGRDHVTGSIDKISIPHLEIRSVTDFRIDYLHEYYLDNEVPRELATMLELRYVTADI